MATEKPGFKRLAVFLGLNFCLSLAVSSIYLFFAGGHPLELAYVSAALVSNTTMLYAVLAIPAALLFLSAPGRGLLAALLAAFQMTLVTDVAIFKIFRFHLNSMVLNLVLTPGGLESLDQGWGTKALFVLIAAALGFAQWRFWRLSEKLALQWRSRRAAAVGALLLLCVAADKGLFAWGTLYDSVYITRNSQLFPLYQPLRIRSFATKYLGVKLDNEVKGGIDLKYSGLAYPAAPLEVAPPDRPLNFLVIVVDSLRADMLNPEVMPESSAFARRAAVFRNHYSGGNCTRFGIFSILYGLYGNYWFPVVGERRGPAFIDVLKRQGYDLRVSASAKLSYPEFNKTCFVDVPRAGIYDEPRGADGAERDSDISDNFISYLRQRDRKKPYFAFIFYDASHGNYDYLPGFEKFKPSSGISQLALSKAAVGPLFNKYKNSLYGDDAFIGRILKAVGATGGLRDTVVLITGDHGEPFYEKGYYGHNQAYSAEEVRVPLVFYEPGRPAMVTETVTSHMDVAPALMRLAGVRNPASDYSNGRWLFEKGPGPFVAVGSWDTAAIIRDGDALVMPLEAYKGGLKVFDAEYRELPKSAAAAFTPLIAQFQKEAKRFKR
ncbi:MAG TPA: sulfatase-like hydrolase/transferase [Elusimicrobiales bacterium]|nr:sulfatase-like hydrolase/transferase [Elusimicrobiales bacterium]